MIIPPIIVQGPSQGIILCCPAIIIPTQDTTGATFYYIPCIYLKGGTEQLGWQYLVQYYPVGRPKKTFFISPTSSPLPSEKWMQLG